MSIAADRDTGFTNRPACETEATRARRAKLEASPVTCQRYRPLLVSDRRHKSVAKFTEGILETRAVAMVASKGKLEGYFSTNRQWLHRHEGILLGHRAVFKTLFNSRIWTVTFVSITSAGSSVMSMTQAHLPCCMQTGCVLSRFHYLKTSFAFHQGQRGPRLTCVHNEELTKQHVALYQPVSDSSPYPANLTKRDTRKLALHTVRQHCLQAGLLSFCGVITNEPLLTVT